ncbi:MdtA/MuxA family multidrug efflux RND transporter periplasmic adaptor subunit [Solimicrobium silvestre]|uniref:Efflux transporter, RND family, MFP subunit n=1 Tax=Solimicrobium silvestre TaxID=2099400 RepID=A0A2S9H1J9_9BURK|nr:MdtA/MuxA family multidrug efflux RND transporter periplasmic adaptor subunit [Solimicrobium silvestre]PRC93830.1 Efflux transporter, RND family, MFP subunit [Solimicrobium silvestre]
MNKITPSSTNSSPSTKSSNKWLWLLALVIIAGAGAVYFSKSAKSAKDGGAASASADGGKHGGANAAKPIPVVTALAKTDDINVYLNGLGTVTPLATVTVKSRIDGEIMKIYFTEGQMVKRGDVLAEIDPRPYQAAWTQAEGQLMRDKALLANARIDLERYRTLLKQDSIASQQVDTQLALVDQYEGTVKVDEGLLATAKLNLVYSKVTAPVSGRAGLRQVDLGNVIHASDSTGIVIITQLQPMSVLFTLPEDSIPALLKNLQSGKKIAVDAYDRAFKEKITSGGLQTIDNQIDPTTGMVKLKAEFANTDLNLFPSQFVNAKLLLETKHNVITVPSSAIQRGRSSSFAFVVAADSTVSQHTVVVGTTQGDKTEVVSGLQSGDIVVIDGADKLRDGAKVDTASNTDAAKGDKGSKDGSGKHKHAASASASASSSSSASAPN